MRAKRISLWVVIVSFFLSLTPFIVNAAHGANTAVAGDFDSYVFSLSWQPAFCETKPDKKECVTQTPDRYDAKNLVLHGLWPNKNDDKQHKYFCGVKSSIKKLDNASTWCQMPAPDLSADTQKNLSSYMPGYASCLERHEWYKHGTCSGLESDAYFTLAYKLASKMADTNFGKYISANVGKAIDSDDLLAEFEKDFGQNSRKYVKLFCENLRGNSLLSEVRLYLSTDLSALRDLKDFLVSPSASEQGSCPQKIFIDPVRADAGPSNSSTGDSSTTPSAGQLSMPAPLLEKNHPVSWWFVFKFNAQAFTGCGSDAQRDCIFGGTVQEYSGKYSQQYVYASSETPMLKKGTGCVGDTLKDPVGATFDQVYNGSFNYVIWNDQFYDDPKIGGCSNSCSSPWGHSKGMVAWNKDGDGFVMQVSTPSWPASGSNQSPRTDGNTLGCVNDNNVKVSQHFFALKLSKDDLKLVLQALQNASVVTDPSNKQIVRNGGPSDLQELVNKLGEKSKGTTYSKVKLSFGAELISKPSGLHVPPWQLVSATLNKLPLRTATWWANPKIDTTTDSTVIRCWTQDLGTPGAVQIAISGNWDGTTFNLKGGPQSDANHAKIGVSLDQNQPYAVFGDLNQQGALSGDCGSSQNGRGGTFYIIKDKALFDSMTSLIAGDTADVAP